MRKYILPIMFIILSCWGCSGGGVGATSPSQIPVAIEGKVQKGPFILGSTIYIQEINDSFQPTGNAFFTETHDDLGSFDLSSEMSTDYVEITAQGFYFNEVSGALSDAQLTLRTFSELSSSEADLNVNLLTTLSKKRVEYLIENDEISFSAARTQTEGEVLDIFNITGDDISLFDQMDISEEGTSNAMLLAISSTLQADNTVGELSELVSKVITDIEEDGTLDNSTSAAELTDNSISLFIIDFIENV